MFNICPPSFNHEFGTGSLLKATLKKQKKAGCAAAALTCSRRNKKRAVESALLSNLLLLCLQLFQRCLMKVLHIDLWKCYLAYVRETKGKLPSYK